MANKRMFSKRITNSARFLKLPLSAQALYFHLSMDTDDDGIVEAYKILMVTKASEGDFQILVDHSLIKILRNVPESKLGCEHFKSEDFKI